MSRYTGPRSKKMRVLGTELPGLSAKKIGTTGQELIELLERRLDNVVFRAGFARSIPAARQLVNHGHVLINGKRVDIASFRVATGDVVTLRVQLVVEFYSQRL